MLATMLVTGATVVAIRSGCPSAGSPPVHSAVGPSPPPMPAQPHSHGARAAVTTRIVRRGIRASMPTPSRGRGVAYRRHMKVDTTVMTGLNDVAAAAREREEAGYSGLWTAETAHDPFLPLV